MASIESLRPPDNGGSNYCIECGGQLRRTKAAGQPVREDHEPGCEAFSRALQVMRYAEELKRAASALKARGAFGGDRRRRRYLEKSAKELSTAACTDDVILAINRLTRQYETERQKGVKPAETVEMLLQASQALAQGKDPAPIPPGPK